MKQDTTELRLTFINVGYGEAILILSLIHI